MKKGLLSADLLMTLLLMGRSSTPVLKSGEIEIFAHKELGSFTSCFFDSIDKADKVTVKSGSLDIQKLGTYSITIVYGNEDYKLKVKIVDKKRPILEWKKKRLIFKLGSNLDKVNDAIRDNAVITDNYDRKLQSFAGFKRIPESDKEVASDVQVKDSSGNPSEKNSLLVQFIGDGKGKLGLKQGHAPAEVSIDTRKVAKKDTKEKEKKKDNKKSERASESKGVDKTDIEIKAQQPEQGQVSSPISDNQNSDKLKDANPKPDSPQATSGNIVEKEFVHPPEKERPVMTVSNFPSYLPGNSGRVSTTYGEAYTRANEWVKLEGGSWHGYYMEIGQPFDDDYANVGDGTTFWTIESFKQKVKDVCMNSFLF